MQKFMANIKFFMVLTLKVEKIAKQKKIVRNVVNLITNLVTRNNLNYRVVVKMGDKRQNKEGRVQEIHQQAFKVQEVSMSKCFTNTGNKCMPTYCNLSVGHINN